ncbi:DUF560 domain-containing protein [Acinetobacter sp. FL51]|jgi:hypothetical protein|nr:MULTISPECIES: surface lipoprotein assembly modifier [Acinetobacter]MBI1453302.1 DUF560 domain-containing protein [Acinetobacter sp. FL51]
MLIPSLIYAADDNDTRLRLEQNLLQQNSEQQQPLKQQQKNDQLPAMTINGETIHINNNLNDLGQALYLAVMQKQWQAARIYLEQYVKLDAYDLALAQFAQGAIARANGQADIAEKLFQDALNLQPANTMIQLELARLLTERQKNKEAVQLFRQVKAQLQQRNDPIAQNIQKTVDVYLNGLKQRDAWQGSVSVGARYASNINSTSEQSSTWIKYAEDQNGNKIPVEQVTRQTEDAINANALDYEATLNKRWSVNGQHGIALKAFGYGRAYDDHQNYNEMTLSLNVGYSYQSQNNQVLLAPVFEHRRYQNASLSNAWGGRAEWMHVLNQKTAFKLEMEAKDIQNTLYANQSGMEYGVFGTVWKNLAKRWTIFGGLDFVDHNSQEQYFTAYQQTGLRLGLSKQFDAGFSTTIFSSLRLRQYDKFNAVLEDQRQDIEQNYMLVLSAPRWAKYGITPNLSYQFNQNNSNVDWLYSYDKHSLSLKLEHRF